MAQFTRKKFAKAVVDMAKKYPLAPVAKAAAEAALKQRWARDIDLVLAEIARQLWQSERHLELKVTTARPLPASLKRKLIEIFKDRWQAKSVAVSEVLDPSIIGGLKVESPAGELDASILTQLNNLKKARS